MVDGLLKAYLFCCVDLQCDLGSVDLQASVVDYGRCHVSVWSDSIVVGGMCVFRAGP